MGEENTRVRPTTLGGRKTRPVLESKGGLQPLRSLKSGTGRLRTLSPVTIVYFRVGYPDTSTGVPEVEVSILSLRVGRVNLSLNSIVRLISPHVRVLD